jgi:Ca-activated chloride channel family protein
VNTLNLLLLLCVCFSTSAHVRAATPALPPTNAQPGDTLIILDASGSMNERIRGESKIVIARRAVRELVESLPDNTRLGLVVYSHRRNACDDIELLIPPAPLDKPAFIAAVDALKPNGRTPVAASIEFAALALNYTKNKASIILVSDGEETCGGDPCATAKKLSENAAGLTIHAVAFDLTARQARAFACVASTTKGRFLQANDAATLKDALVVAVSESTVSVKAEPPAEDLSPATITVPRTVAAGADFSASWQGPNNPGDYLCIVLAGAPDDAYENTSYTRQGSPLTMTALLEAGNAEVRYIAGRSRKILGRASLVISPIGVTLEAVNESVAGSPLKISWSGPNHRGDYVTIVPKSVSDDVSGRYFETSKGSPVTATTPIQPGDAEIRYISGQGRKVLARRPLHIVPAKVTLDAPAEVVAGSPLEVVWTGPNHDDDFIVIVPKTAADTAWRRPLATRHGSPSRMTAPIEPGDAEVRYYSGEGHQVLARRPIKVTAASVTLDGPAEALAGSEIQVAWTGPNNENDFLAVVPKSAADGAWKQTMTTRQGSPLKLSVPIEAGDGEIRYISGIGHKVLARRTLQIVAAEVTLEAPAEAVPGSVVDVTWTGPNNENDFLAIVPKGAPDGSWKRTSYTRGGSPAKVTAPIEPGDAEIRYLSGTGHKVLARRPIKLAAATITLDAPAQVTAGSLVEVTWTGPNLNNDFLVIMPKSAADGAWKRTTYTRGGSPAKVAAPIEPGVSEIRYISGEGNKVLARRPITVAAAEITMSAPDEVIAASTVSVEWSGPNNTNDFMAIVPKSAPDGSWKTTGYTRNGSPLKLVAPSEAGPSEIRYYSGNEYKVLARRPVTVKAAEIKLTVPASAPAGSIVSIEWIGPNHPNDYLSIVPKGAKDGVTGKLTYTRSGSPAKVAAPATAGPAEVRYINGGDNRVLARADLTLTTP